MRSFHLPQPTIVITIGVNFGFTCIRIAFSVGLCPDPQEDVKTEIPSWIKSWVQDRGVGRGK